MPPFYARQENNVEVIAHTYNYNINNENKKLHVLLYNEKTYEYRIDTFKVIN